MGDFVELVILAVHNLSKDAGIVKLKLEAEVGKHLIELLGSQHYQAIDDSSHTIQLEGYGYYWFRVGRQHL